MTHTHRPRKTGMTGPMRVAAGALLIMGLASHAQEPWFEGLGDYTRTVTTSSPEAQRYFNQGLAFLHGFNHGAADIAEVDRRFQKVWANADIPISSSCLCVPGQAL